MILSDESDYLCNNITRPTKLHKQGRKIGERRLILGQIKGPNPPMLSNYKFKVFLFTNPNRPSVAALLGWNGSNFECRAGVALSATTLTGQYPSSYVGTVSFAQDNNVPTDDQLNSQTITFKYNNIEKNLVFEKKLNHFKKLACQSFPSEMTGVP